MINRVLIRIKVIQLLYSYLLVEKHFMLESQPVPPTTEKRFAYSLYLDLLVLMVKISRHLELRKGYLPLETTRFISRVSTDDIIKNLLMKYNVEPFPYQDLVAPLSETIKESAIFKNFIKTRGEERHEAEPIWEQIFNVILYPSPLLNEAIATRPTFSMRGVDRVRKMMNETFSNFYTSGNGLGDALNELDKSLAAAHSLYKMLLLLPVELTRMESQMLDENRHKYITTEQDLNPDLRFVENQLVERIASNEKIQEFEKSNKFSWFNDDQHLLRHLLKVIKESDIYLDYMDFPVTDLSTDCEFWRNVFKHIIFNDEEFLETLEDKSVFWNDDLEIIGTFVLKTIRRFEEGDPADAVLGMFKDREDEEFGGRLYRYVVTDKDIYKGMIDRALDHKSWASERLAFMDVVIVMTALAEMLNFPKIPLTVSLNEYIEIAKSYSTPKSGPFVNGLLATIIKQLRDSGELLK